MNKQNYKITRGKTEIELSHKDKNITFIHPSYGPSTYAGVKELIEKDGLSTPTLSETVSLVYPAFVGDKEKKVEEFNDIKELMKNNWLWGFTGILYTPKIIYVQDNPETRNGMPFMDENSLVEKLEQIDQSVRQVEYGFDMGSMSALNLARNKFIISLVGEEGADKLSQIADTFNINPYLWSFKKVDKNLTRVSALDSDRYLDRGLDVGGGHGDDRNGCAFGIRRKIFSSGNK